MKEEIAQVADELAMSLYNREFYELSDELQTTVWRQAEEEYINYCIGCAERYKDEEEGR